MAVYPINIKESASIEVLQKGTFLFIYRATRIPPHIGVVTNGMLYDITAVGPNIDLPVADFFKTAVKRKTEVLFVKLDLPKVDTNKIISKKVKQHWKVTATKSCLVPVKEFLTEVCDIELEKATFLFDLLPVLEEEKLVKGVYELNLQKKIKNNVFELTKYSQQDIDACINALNRKEQFSC